MAILCGFSIHLSLFVIYFKPTPQGVISREGMSSYEMETQKPVDIPYDTNRSQWREWIGVGDEDIEGKFVSVWGVCDGDGYGLIERK
jgi:hypothetical protein